MLKTAIFFTHSTVLQVNHLVDSMIYVDTENKQYKSQIFFFFKLIHAKSGTSKCVTHREVYV